MRICKLIVPLFLLVMNCISSVCFGADVTVYFYNPETNINNFALLKSSFDSYLSVYGDYQFQPFDSQDKIEQNIRKGSIYLLSSWHLNALQQKFPLKIALVGTFKGNSTQKKILSVKKEMNDFSMLKNATISGAGSEEYNRSILQQIEPEKYKELADSIKILKVPKDIDALMAVGFGVADAAIAAENNLKILESLNSNQHKKLHSLGSSEQSYLLVAATLDKPDKNEMKVLNILFGMSGKKDLNLLGLDGWIWK